MILSKEKATPSKSDPPENSVLFSLKELRRLEQQRRGHLPGRPMGRSAWIAAAAGATLFLAIGGGLAGWVSRQHQAEKTALEREIARRSEQAWAAQLVFDARIRDLEEKAHRYAGEALTAKDRARILRDLQPQQQPIEAARPRPLRQTAPPMQPTAAPPPPASASHTSQR
jgi:hypothetical protein